MTALAVRLIGGLLLAAAGGLAGSGLTAERKRKLALLRELDAGLGLMADELTVLRTPLPQIFAQLRARPFFRLLDAGFGGEPTETLWRRAAGTLDLDRKDREALSALAPVVGRYDAVQQVAELSLARSRLNESAAEIEAELRGRAGSFPGLGAALGALLAVLLF